METSTRKLLSIHRRGILMPTKMDMEAAPQPKTHVRNLLDMSAMTPTVMILVQTYPRERTNSATGSTTTATDKVMKQMPLMKPCGMPTQIKTDMEMLLLLSFLYCSKWLCQQSTRL